MIGLNHLKRQRKRFKVIETMHMIKKGQVKLKSLSAHNNVQLFSQLFGVTV